MAIHEENGVHLHIDRMGRASGEAFVQFTNAEDCEKALKRNLDKIGHRWVGLGICVSHIFFIRSYVTFRFDYQFLLRI